MVVASVVGIMFSRSSASSISMDESIAFYGIQALFVFAWVAALRTVGITIHRVKGPRSTTPDAPADEVTPSEQQ